MGSTCPDFRRVLLHDEIVRVDVPIARREVSVPDTFAADDKLDVRHLAFRGRSPPRIACHRHLVGAVRLGTPTDDAQVDVNWMFAKEFGEISQGEGGPCYGRRIVDTA